MSAVILAVGSLPFVADAGTCKVFTAAGADEGGVKSAAKDVGKSGKGKGKDSEKHGSSSDGSGSGSSMDDVVDQLNVPAKQRRKRKIKNDKNKVEATIEKIPWLSTLLHEVEDSGSDSERTKAEAETQLPRKTAPSRSQVQPVQPEPVPDLAKVAKVAIGLVAEAFDPVSGPRFQDDLESQEENILDNLNKESGINDMISREDKLLQRACEQLSNVSETSASSSPLLEENIAGSIAQHVAAGLDPEEAAEEAMLNHVSLLGNQSTTETSRPQLDSDDVDVDRPFAPAISSIGVKTQAMNRMFFHAWVDEVVLSFQAFQYKVSAQKRPVGDGGELSLVLGKIQEPRDATATSAATTAKPVDQSNEPESDTVFWVHWKFAGDLGRPASLDKENRVKCLVAAGKLREPRDYKSVEIIIPAIGCRMERVRGYKAQLRPKVPDPITRLHDMYQAALISKDSHSAGPQREQLTPLEKYAIATKGLDQCFVCGVSSNKQVFPAEGTQVAQDPVRTCPFCLLTAHSACMTDLVEYVQNHEAVQFPSGVDIGSLELPDLFDAEEEPSLCCSQRSQLPNRCMFTSSRCSYTCTPTDTDDAVAMHWQITGRKIHILILYSINHIMLLNLWVLTENIGHARACDTQRALRLCN